MKKTKFLKYIFLSILFLILTVFGHTLYQGYRTYKIAISKQSIVDAVQTYREKPNYVDYASIDSDFIHAIIAIEDRRFFLREGIDWRALFRAALRNLKANQAVEGGSTITQQIAKNLYFVRQKRGIYEKIAEVYIMYDLEHLFSKEELLALYSNMNYYGDGYWGIHDAADGYFHTSADQLSIAQASLLAGIINAPSAYQLSTGYDLALQRQKKVLQAMRDTNYISADEYQEAQSEKISH